MKTQTSSSYAVCYLFNRRLFINLKHHKMTNNKTADNFINKLQADADKHKRYFSDKEDQM